MGLGGLYLYRQIKDMPPSNWLGKASTGVFFVVLAILVLFPVPRPWATALITLALALAVAALLRYAAQCFHLVKETP